MKQSKIDSRLAITQRQAIIKLLTKKDRDRKFVKNWWPISLLNVDTKLLAKSLAEKLKHAFPDLISNQTAYVKNRCIGKSDRLILNTNIIKWSTIMCYKWGIYNSIFEFRGARQSDPISAYLFILALTVPFALIK